jgi:hypothetical protein
VRSTLRARRCRRVGFYRDQAGGPGGAKYQRAGGHESFVDMGGIFEEMFGSVVASAAPARWRWRLPGRF